MSEWREFGLRNALAIKHGFAFKSEYFRDRGSLIVLTPGNFHDAGGFKQKSGAEKFYDGPVPDGFVLSRGDVVVAMTEQAHGLLGSSATIPSDDVYLHNQRIGLVRIRDPQALDLRFVYHLFNSPRVRRQLQATATGSKVRHTAPERIESLEVSLPGIDLQRAIAGILDAIDDLIENNRRRIALLERMAQAIYREWFVHFRYPGHEDDELVDFIPSTWRWITLGACGTWLSGGTPSTVVPEYWGGDIPWITSGTLTSMLLDRSERRLTEAGVRAGTRVIDRDGLLFVVRGMSLVKEFRVGIADRKLAFGQDCKAIVATDDLEPLYLAFSVLTMATEIQGMVELAGHGTGKLSTDRLQALEIPLPPQSVQRAFVKLVSPMRESMSSLRDSTDRLEAVRTGLLPKLVTGAIDVSHLDLDARLEEPAA